MRNHSSQNKQSLWAKFRSLWSMPEDCHHRSQYRARPQVEMLEDRQLLTVFTVNTLQDNLVIGDNALSLREAIRAASTNQQAGDAPAGDPVGDIIIFDSTVFGGAGATIQINDNTGLGDFEITDDLTIDGASGSGGGATLVTIDGINLNRIFDINSGTNGPVMISGVTLTNGNGTDDPSSTGNDG